MIITFIAPAYYEPIYNRVLVDSLLCQEDRRWKLIIYHNGPNNEMRKWSNSYNDQRIKYIESKTDTGHYGTYNRIQALEHYLDSEYVIQTSIQDYYLSWAVKLILQRLEETNADMCFWNSLNHLSGYEILNAELKRSHIDWGNFCLSSPIGKILSVEKPEDHCADWFTLEKGINNKVINKLTKISNVLTIHN